MTRDHLSVALPWSLSHYIPLNGFHPLYRALFDECPGDMTLNAWDNIALSETLRKETATRLAFQKLVQGWEGRLKESHPSPLRQQYHDAFFIPNLAATALLPGDIELHHTAAFPSMTRPFVLHCESFLPVFYPFGSIAQAQAMCGHYEAMFASPLCLGIFSHIQDTLAELSRFFESPVIDGKLFASRIGLSRQAVPPAKPAFGPAPGFLFAGAATADFFQRGGHNVLRAWRAILARCPGAKLYLRCARPEDALLAAQGVDLDFLKREQTNSIIWIEPVLSQSELNRLLARVHFFLLPGTSLDSVAMMQAMAAGAVPIVADTIGTSRYVTHGQTGIVLQGDHAAEISQHVTALLDVPAAYTALQGRAMETAAAEFSGAAFAGEFWSQVRELVEKEIARKNFFFEKKKQKTFDCFPPGNVATPRVKSRKSLLRSFSTEKRPLSFLHCLVPTPDWPRIFESVPQPVTRIYTGIGQVTELGGAFIHGKPEAGAGPHAWSALAEFCREDAASLTFAASIGGLDGKYLTASSRRASLAHRFVQRVARLLYPYPALYRASARLLRHLRRLRARLRKPPAPEPLNIQLLAQNVSGMNIIRAGDQVYAIPQDGGEFSVAKAEAGFYRLSFKGASMAEVMTKIAGHESLETTPAAQLAEEGVNGLNIIRCGELFIAIPQGEGAFDQRRALANGYSRVFVGQSLGEVKTSILEAAS